MRDNGFVPAAGHIDGVYPRLLCCLGKPYRVGAVGGARDKSVSGDTDGNGEVRPYSLPYPSDDRKREPAPVLPAPSVFVLPKIGGGREELADQVPRRAQYLHCVEARLFGPHRRLRPLLLHLVDLGDGHGPGRLPGIIRKYGRGGPGLFPGILLLGVSSGVVELHRKLYIRRSAVDCIGKRSPAWDIVVGAQAHHIQTVAVIVYPAAAGNDQSHSALCPLDVELLDPLIHMAILAVGQLDGGLYDPIFYRHPVDFNWGKQPFILHLLFLPSHLVYSHIKKRIIIINI